MLTRAGGAGGLVMVSLVDQLTLPRVAVTDPDPATLAENSPLVEIDPPMEVHVTAPVTSWVDPSP